MMAVPMDVRSADDIEDHIDRLLSLQQPSHSHCYPIEYFRAT